MKLFYYIRIEYKFWKQIITSTYFYKQTHPFCEECGRDIYKFIISEKVSDKIEFLFKENGSLCYDCFCRKCKMVGLPIIWELKRIE